MECKGNKLKREEMVDVFREGKFRLLALMEIKFKGNGEVSLCGIKGIIAGVFMRWKELGKRWPSC